MLINFPKCLTFVLTSEGGWSSNSHDPGGDTMKGITLKVYREWRKDDNITPAELLHISDADVSAIYKQNYWDRVHGDDLNSGVDLSVFDMQVNSGANSAKILQATVGVKIDGVVGPMTVAAANAIEPMTLINSLATNQAAFYHSLSNFKYFGKGWINRTNARLVAALAMIGTQHMAMAKEKATDTSEHFFKTIKSIA